MNTLNVINRRTVEQFKSDCKTSKLSFRRVVNKDQTPVTYKDANGADTGVQKRAIVDTAGNTIAWCSCAIARKFDAGESLKGLNLAIIDSESNGEVFTTLCLANTAGEFEAEEL